ncbi:DUF3224 domain-containing protein [Nocardia thailandica]|uniref:DUF3224 domain-containing protein n=1 Tax=Nocardia thailandica TaxID=257275 RepID=A0ABW6PKK9_9NOCA
MKATGTFEVTAFEPTEVTNEPPVTAGLPVGISRMSKTYSGDLTGESATLFTAAFDMASGAGTYIAIDTFEGTLAGRAGAFSFVHSATTGGTDRTDEFFHIVPASGTGELSGITGGGALWVDERGGHHITFDYELP